MAPVVRPDEVAQLSSSHGYGSEPIVGLPGCIRTQRSRHGFDFVRRIGHGCVAGILQGVALGEQHCPGCRQALTHNALVCENPSDRLTWFASEQRVRTLDSRVYGT
jgi:hypothetical protein